MGKIYSFQYTFTSPHNIFSLLSSIQIYRILMILLTNRICQSCNRLAFINNTRFNERFLTKSLHSHFFFLNIFKSIILYPILKILLSNIITPFSFLNSIQIIQLSNMNSNQSILNSQHIHINQDLDIQDKINHFNSVHSLVVKKDQKGNIIDQWTELIKIIRVNKKKPFIGGYNNLRNNTEYWNATAQTDQKKTNHKLCFTRQTQTYDKITKSTKVQRQIGTQMQKEGLFIDKRTDKIAEAGMYFDSQMWQQRRNEAALFIQRLTRGWFARKLATNLKNQKIKQYRKQLQEENQFRKAEELRHKQEIERRRNPKTQKDFQILYQELEMWRVTELQKIRDNKSLTEDQRKRALKETLDKQIDLLQTIDRLKISANKDQKVIKIEKYLKAMSDPKQWKRNSDGRITEVHTPFTIRAKELMDLYKGLKMKNITTDERLDILLNTKWTVKEWDCNLTREIVELIDREANMLDRGRPQKSLQGLRQRLANLFLQFIEYPLFNPEAARFQKIPYEISELVDQDNLQTKSKIN